MNDKLNQAVIKSIEEIFEKMIEVKVKNNEPIQKTINEVKYDLNIVISIIGELSGSITFKISKELAHFITSKMLGFNVEKDSDDIKDAIGEFLNIIMGIVKRNYSSKNIFDISIPTVIIGDDYLVYTKASKNDKVSLIDFNYNGNSFCIEIYLK